MDALSAAEQSMALPIKPGAGQTLDGRFLLLEQIGRGGMATVWKATDLASAGLVAIKVPLPQYASGVGSWSMFQREAEIGRTLDHPSIVKFIELPAGVQRGNVVMEYVAGEPLAERIGGGRMLGEAEALAIVSRLCDAVDYLHRRGFVHYDIKPGNVLLLNDGSPRLIDFGLAHELTTSRFPFSASAPPIASSSYVAPEQIRRTPGRASVDIYGLGATLYEMLTGHPPFEGDDPFAIASARRIADPIAPRLLNPKISPQAEEIVLRALRRDRSERYATAAAFKADLDHVADVRVSGLAGRLVAITPCRKAARWARYLAVVGVVPLAAIVVLFRFLWWYLEHRR